MPGLADLLAGSVLDVAPRLLGAVIAHETAEGTVAVRLTEVEAYDGPNDPGSHAHNGRTRRNQVMFGPPGYAYVYRSYGIHWCLNFVCEREGSASAVLIRALAPTHGLAVMRRRRGLADERVLCAGPGRLCQALGITQAHNGLALDAPPFAIYPRGGQIKLVIGPRIGITKAADLPWRYGLAGSRFLSRPFRASRNGA